MRDNDLSILLSETDDPLKQCIDTAVASVNYFVATYRLTNDVGEALADMFLNRLLMKLAFQATRLYRYNAVRNAHMAIDALLQDLIDPEAYEAASIGFLVKLKRMMYPFSQDDCFVESLAVEN